MSARRLAWDVALLLLAGTGLCAGLTRLATAPLLAVLIILGAMGMLMFPTASACGIKIRSCRTNRSRTRFMFNNRKTE
jgi:fucose permease